MINAAIAVSDRPDRKRASATRRTPLAVHSASHISVSVAHSSPLLAAGLMATLQKLPGCLVALVDETQLSQRGGAAVDVLITDRCSALGQTDVPPGTALATNRQRPRVILLTNEPRSALHPGPNLRAFDVCLPTNCPTDDLISAVRRLRPAVLWPGASAELDSAGSSLSVRGGLPPGKLRAVLAYIDDHLTEGAGLITLAEIAGMSCCHFARAFKRSIGVPAHQYLISRRISASLALIRDTDRALCEISLEVGFADQSHFTRTFVQMTGMTPGDYRHGHR